MAENRDDRGRGGLPEALAALERDEQAGKAYLGDPATVEGLLRAWAKTTIDILAALGRGTIGRDQAKQDVQADVQRLADIFLGRSGDYSPIPGWNDPKGDLPKALRDLGLDESDPDALVRTAMLIFHKEIADAMAENAKGADRAISLIEQTVYEWTYRMLGIPMPQPEDLDDPAA